MSRSKEAAGRAAAERVRDGMTVGLGTGSTVYFTLQRLGERVRQDKLAIVGVPTSVDTEVRLPSAAVTFNLSENQEDSTAGGQATGRKHR